MLTRFCAYNKQLASLVQGKSGLKVSGAALILSVLVLYSGLTIAWTPYTGPNRTYPSIYPAALQPNVIVDAVFPENVTYGQIFDLAVQVANNGNVPANNVHLLYKATPLGFFIVQNVDQPACALGQDSEDVSLGNLSTNRSKEINFMLQVPTKEQVSGVWSKNFRFDFSVSYDSSVSSYAGYVELLIRHGKLLLVKKGFN
ncbi:MAG: hypothetical protein ACYDHZ_01795 [Dehalococcoidia bacterium]